MNANATQPAQLPATIAQDSSCLLCPGVAAPHSHLCALCNVEVDAQYARLASEPKETGRDSDGPSIHWHGIYCRQDRDGVLVDAWIDDVVAYRTELPGEPVTHARARELAEAAQGDLDCLFMDAHREWADEMRADALIDRCDWGCP